MASAFVIKVNLLRTAQLPPSSVRNDEERCILCHRSRFSQVESRTSNQTIFIDSTSSRSRDILFVDVILLQIVHTYGDQLR